jgi:hypothetical protein
MVTGSNMIDMVLIPAAFQDILHFARCNCNASNSECPETQQGSVSQKQQPISGRRRANSQGRKSVY